MTSSPVGLYLLLDDKTKEAQSTVTLKGPKRMKLPTIRLGEFIYLLRFLVIYLQIIYTLNFTNHPLPRRRLFVLFRVSCRQVMAPETRLFSPILRV